MIRIRNRIRIRVPISTNVSWSNRRYSPRLDECIFINLVLGIYYQTYGQSWVRDIWQSITQLMGKQRVR